MPLYEYRCAKCGKVFERLQKFSDPPVVVHEECGGLVERLISAPAFHLKGSGWYASDYPKSSPKPESKSEESKSEAKEDSKTESKSDSKSDSKLAATTETKTESKTEAPAAKTD